MATAKRIAVLEERNDTQVKLEQLKEKRIALISDNYLGPL